MLGIYEQLIDIINDKNQENIVKIRKILPLVFGILVGAFTFGKVLLFFYNKHSYEMMYIFMGLIIGSIPVLVKEVVNKKERISSRYLVVSLIISLVIFIIPNILNFNIVNKFNIINLFLGGFLYIGGKIIPGISSSFFLMILGLYNYLLEMITNPLSITINKLISLIPFFLGILVGLYLFIKLISLLLNKYFSNTYSSIIGFILGSVFAIFPGIEISIKGALSFILMILSYFLVSKLAKK